MKKAAGMLTDVNYKSYDIAYYIGYDNPKSFSRAFKNYYGMTPMEYRSGKIKQDKIEYSEEEKRFIADFYEKVLLRDDFKSFTSTTSEIIPKDSFASRNAA